MKAKNKIGSAIKKTHGWIVEIILLPVKAYRKHISSFKPYPTCRFTPTCSEYAILALREWGIIIGGILAVIRIIRCNPFSKKWEDPVPSRKAFFEKVKNFFTKKHSKV